MDNASIHPSKELKETISKRGYHCVYLPFLNPIKDYWSKLKASFRRNRFKDGERVSDRVIEAAKTIFLEDLSGWMKHSLSLIPLCQERVINL
ncbi:hypothetical protein RO3G_11133 [Rhizopus delemar RA 99-880]|uniref:Tc1-like transposase DDE domain-containing protein n=1 Tax=Rhizopus delemar (strain RA 99-880 / ATCC MYA-4621 / FGSC 9543 / NRRL 43880) TaxID=246409 RepID=I1CD92_RHIO9|nr:hypothetical protein RO3G_11133 [Rhizopus delemar RA 99-880]|eukprot:EIE86422.1 hypothetical protein RO3G_11133 [Rhizopus delemar RA 99-880]